MYIFEGVDVRAYSMTLRFAAAASLCCEDPGDIYLHEDITYVYVHLRSLQLSSPDIYARASTCTHYNTTSRLRRPCVDCLSSSL